MLIQILKWCGVEIYTYILGCELGFKKNWGHFLKNGGQVFKSPIPNYFEPENINFPQLGLLSHPYIYFNTPPKS